MAQRICIGSLEGGALGETAGDLYRGVRPREADVTFTTRSMLQPSRRRLLLGQQFGAMLPHHVMFFLKIELLGGSRLRK